MNDFKTFIFKNLDYIDLKINVLLITVINGFTEIN